MAFSKKQKGEFIFRVFFKQKTQHPFVFLKGAFQRYFRVFFQSRKAEEKERNAREWKKYKEDNDNDGGGGGNSRAWSKTKPPHMTPPPDPPAAPGMEELRENVKTLTQVVSEQNQTIQQAMIPSVSSMPSGRSSSSSTAPRALMDNSVPIIRIGNEAKREHLQRVLDSMKVMISHMLNVARILDEEGNRLKLLANNF